VARRGRGGANKPIARPRRKGMTCVGPDVHKESVRVAAVGGACILDCGISDTAELIMGCPDRVGRGLSPN